jgi:hypothetical protein
MKWYRAVGIALFTTALLLVNSALHAQFQLSNVDFQGRFLAVLSDADMQASAYIDGQLSDRTPEMVDTLTLIPLGNDRSPITLEVSNSVMG